MLTLTVPGREFWNEDEECFVSTKSKTITLEHSLISLSKWESKWKKPFLSTQKTVEESIDYIRCMTITQSVHPEVYLGITPSLMNTVNEYIADPMTATWFSKEQEARMSRGPKSGEVVTSELIYYWMVSFRIPAEYERWHLNRLLTLIKICNLKQEKPQKIPKGQLARSNSALNAARRARMGSRG